MKSVTVDSWQKLCEEAVHEKDPKRLLELMLEIDRLLEEKEHNGSSRLMLLPGSGGQPER